MLKLSKQTAILLISLLPCLAMINFNARCSDEDTRKLMLTLDVSKLSFPKKKETRVAVVEELAKTGDMRLRDFFQDFMDHQIFVWNGQLVYCKDPEHGSPLLDPLTREPLAGNPVASHAIVSEWSELSTLNQGDVNRIKAARSKLGLFSSDGVTRKESVITLAKEEQVALLPMLTEMLPKESDSRVRFALEESIARLQLVSATGAEWKPEYMDAVRKLGQLRSRSGKSKLIELQAAYRKSGANPEAAKAVDEALAKIEASERLASGADILFRGLSAGSILILMALGLSIIFGLMGVINMAHGELVMIGAYTTYVIQCAFQRWMPESAFNYHFVAAIPIAFVVTALVGFLMEKLVIRHLYGRPLETLLATWGVSLILIQAVRLMFGDNISVRNPTWFQGGFEIMPDVSIAYNRVFIIGFCLLCIALMYWIIDRTKLGLLLRATTQNRNMAASLGVHTRRIDGYTFGLGAGLAGMAGCAATLVNGVTPDMGKNYVIDSFLVVVVGGVGKLAGAIFAGLGLGVLNNIFEPFLGTTWGKVTLLICIVLFIQWRPSGLFPAKGRTADA